MNGAPWGEVRCHNLARLESGSGTSVRGEGETSKDEQGKEPLLIPSDFRCFVSNRCAGWDELLIPKMCISSVKSLIG